MLNDSVSCSPCHSMYSGTPITSEGGNARKRKDKHSPTRRKGSTVPSSYSVQQLKVLSFCSSLSLLLLSCLAFSPSLRACVTSPARSLLSVSRIQNLPLSAPARSVCHANPSLPPPSPRLHHLLLLCWLSVFLSLVCLLFFPLVTHSLLFFSSPTHSFLSGYPSLLFC